MKSNGNQKDISPKENKLQSENRKRKLFQNQEIDMKYEHGIFENLKIDLNLSENFI